MANGWYVTDGIHIDMDHLKKGEVKYVTPQIDASHHSADWEI